MPLIRFINIKIIHILRMNKVIHHMSYNSDLSNIVKLHKDRDTREGTRGQESFSLRVTRLCNDLPEVVVTAPCVNSFKNPAILNFLA